MVLLKPNNPQNMLLIERLRPYIDASTAKNTKKAYRCDLEHFKMWGGTIPCLPEMLCDYLVTYGEELAVSTLQRRLASISKAHNALNCSNPVKTEVVRLTIKGIRRKHGTTQRQAKPLVKEDILLMLAGMQKNTKTTRDTALLLIGFCGAFRRSELVSLNVEDIEFVREGIIINLLKSKTDQEGKGRKIAIPYGRGTVCPIKSLQNWLVDGYLTEGAIFRSVDKSGRIQNRRLSDRSVSSIIKQRAKAVGIDSEYISGHSLRAGLATSAAQHGIPIHKIQAQTGHASETMLNRYIRDGDLFNNNASGIF